MGEWRPTVLFSPAGRNTSVAGPGLEGGAGGALTPDELSFSLKLKRSLKLIGNLRSLKNLSGWVPAPDLTSCPSRRSHRPPTGSGRPGGRVHFDSFSFCSFIPAGDETSDQHLSRSHINGHVITSVLICRKLEFFSKMSQSSAVGLLA